MEDWITLKEAGDLLGVSAAAIRYRALKKQMYEHRREEREYGETVVVSTRSLLDQHPELREKLESHHKPLVKEDAPTSQKEVVGTTPSPEDGPKTVSVHLATSAVGKPKMANTDRVDTDRIRTLLDKLEEIKIQQLRIKEELKTLLERL